MKINLEKGKVGQMSAQSEIFLIIKRKTKQEFKLRETLLLKQYGTGRGEIGF